MEWSCDCGTRYCECGCYARVHRSSSPQVSFILPSKSLAKRGFTRTSNKRGMTPRIFEYLFSRIQKEEEDRQNEQLRYVCKCSFLEIYNEQITDLLEPTSSNLQMREDSKKGVYVENLTEKAVDCVQDVVMLLLKGASNRKVACRLEMVLNLRSPVEQ